MRIASNSHSPRLHCHKIFFSSSSKILPYNSFVEIKSLIEIDYLSILEINGKGSSDLLQGQITSDMDKGSSKNCALGAICNIKGRVLSSFIVSMNPCQEDSFFLISDHQVLQNTKEVLEKYRPFYKCSMEINNEYNFFGIREEDLIMDFPETDLKSSFQNYESFFRLHYLDKKFHLIALKSAEIEGYSISSDMEPWKLDEIICQNIEVSPDIVEKFTPHELGYHLTSRIDFEKGCYTGQEIVARMHYRAKKLPTISVIKTEKIVKPFEEVLDLDGKSMGIILSNARNDDSTSCLLSLNKNFLDQELDL